MTGDAERLSAPGAEGLSLQALIEASPRLDELSTARVIGEAAEAVHKAQKGGQVLATLSPAAIMVSASGAVTLELPAAGGVGYTAPERLRGSPGDRRSDVFSLGVLLWEALAHERLFTGANDDAVKAALLAGEVRLPSTCNANIPAELDAICRKALARDPADRYPSAKVMAAELDAVLDDAGYPESNEEIARYVVELQARPPAPAPAKLSSVSQEWTSIGRATVLGVEPVKGAPLPSITAKSAEPAPSEGSKPPSPSSLPAWAHARPPEAASEAPRTAPEPNAPAVAVPQQMPAISEPIVPAGAPLVLGPIPGGTVEPGSPSKLSALPMGMQTAILGSLGAAAEPAPEPSPAPVILGSRDSSDRVELASVNWHDHSSAASVKPAPSEVETEQLASLAVDKPAAQAGAPAEHTASQAGSISAVAAIPDAEDSFTEAKATPHPASVVALRSRSRTDQTGGDMLGGWGWTSDSSSALEEEEEYEDHSRPRKRLLLAIGGGAAALLLVAVIAIAASGSKSKDEPTPAPTAQASKAWDTTPPPAPAPPAPAEPAAATEPAQPPPETEPAKPETAAVEPARPETTAGEPARPETTAAEPAKPDTAKLAAQPDAAKPDTAKPDTAKPDTAKPDAARVAARPDTARPDAAKSTAKPEPKNPFTVAARKPDKPRFDAATAKPVDPYAADAKKPEKTEKTDPNAAYKAGLQQFARGDSNGALATFKASLAANPGFAPTWRGIGLVYEKMGRKAQARTAFQKYLELAPTAGDADLIRERMDRL